MEIETKAATLRAITVDALRADGDAWGEVIEARDMGAGAALIKEFEGDARAANAYAIACVDAYTALLRQLRGKAA